MHLVASTTLLRESLSGILWHNKHSSVKYLFKQVKIFSLCKNSIGYRCKLVMLGICAFPFSCREKCAYDFKDKFTNPPPCHKHI